MRPTTAHPVLHQPVHRMAHRARRLEGGCVGVVADCGVWVQAADGSGGVLQGDGLWKLRGGADLSRADKHG